MAVGDFTIDSTTLRSAGNHWRVSGTMDAGTDPTEFDIFPNGYIVSFSIDHAREDADAGSVRIHTNASDFSATAKNGAIYADAESVERYTWTADYIT